jgi:hypothetical protein
LPASPPAPHRCGVTTDVTTTALAVPFGTMVLNTFKTLAQDITVSTNATGGYVVTASENDQLGKEAPPLPNIADSLQWRSHERVCLRRMDDRHHQRLLASLSKIFDAAATSFLYTTATGNCTGTFCGRQFADITGSETPQTIFSSTTVANAENVYVCYRLGVGATQAAGDYENQIIYTATGTF